eukprot:g3347.t1
MKSYAVYQMLCVALSQMLPLFAKLEMDLLKLRMKHTVRLQLVREHGIKGHAAFQMLFVVRLQTPMLFAKLEMDLLKLRMKHTVRLQLVREHGIKGHAAFQMLFVVRLQTPMLFAKLEMDLLKLRMKHTVRLQLVREHGIKGHAAFQMLFVVRLQTPMLFAKLEMDLLKLQMKPFVTRQFAQRLTMNYGVAIQQLLHQMLPQCSVNKKVSSSQCIACEAGATNAAGDDATGADTTCASVQCSINEKVKNHKCIPCEAGAINAAGNNATGADTSCDPILCVANEKVENHTCISCEAGAINTAGDHATGIDTACSAILCNENERVSNHTCISCEAGAVNDAGDDATGDDTECEEIACGKNEHVAGYRCVPCHNKQINDAGDLATGKDTSQLRAQNFECDISSTNTHAAIYLCIPTTTRNNTYSTTMLAPKLYDSNGLVATEKYAISTYAAIRAKDCTYVSPNVLAPSTVVLGKCTVDDELVVPLLSGRRLDAPPGLDIFQFCDESVDNKWNVSNVTNMQRTAYNGGVYPGYWSAYFHQNDWVGADLLQPQPINQHEEDAPSMHATEQTSPQLNGRAALSMNVTKTQPQGQRLQMPKMSERGDKGISPGAQDI